MAGSAAAFHTFPIYSDDAATVDLFFITRGSVHFFPFFSIRPIHYYLRFAVNGQGIKKGKKTRSAEMKCTMLRGCLPQGGWMRVTRTCTARRNCRRLFLFGDEVVETMRGLETFWLIQYRRVFDFSWYVLLFSPFLRDSSGCERWMQGLRELIRYGVLRILGILVGRLEKILNTTWH